MLHHQRRRQVSTPTYKKLISISNSPIEYVFLQFSQPSFTMSLHPSTTTNGSTLNPTKPTILLIPHGVRIISPELQARVTSLFNIIDYDCQSVKQCISRMAPGGPYSKLDAIVRTGWLKADPFIDHVLFRGKVVEAYPESLKLICCTGHGYDV